ncbi:MAG TPA: Yip1 family protein [Caulobacter sp.]|nr:Yip1 family protein [Caulobacter sp.]
MSVVEGGTPSGLVQRVQDILLRPKPTWDTIAGEAATVKGLYTGYICILAAIGPICQFVGKLLFGGFGFAPFTLVGAVVGYVLSLVGVYVTALIIDALAPSFGGEKNPIQAFKVAAYSSTAAWLAGVFDLVPMLAWLGIVGLYSLYLLYLGLPKLMKAPEDKAVGYTIVIVIATVVIYGVIAMIMMSVMGLGMVGAVGAAALTGGL